MAIALCRSVLGLVVVVVGYWELDDQLLGHNKLAPSLGLYSTRNYTVMHVHAD